MSWLCASGAFNRKKRPALCLDYTLKMSRAAACTGA